MVPGHTQGSAAQDLASLDTQDLVPVPQALAPSGGEQGWLSGDLWVLDKEPLGWEAGAHMSAVGRDGELEGCWQRAAGASAGPLRGPPGPSLPPT